MTARGTAPHRRRRERHGEAREDGDSGGNLWRPSCNRGPVAAVAAVALAAALASAEVVMATADDTFDARQRG